MTTKYIFVTGGVVSSIGKGICAAAIGRILKSRGLTVAVQKLDPYLNVDPGTMSPYQHGEVFVTRDGCETDLDLGHYERFIDIELTHNSNITAGQVYTQLLGEERRGDHLGGTIQTVPHVTNVIKEFMLRAQRKPVRGAGVPSPQPSPLVGRGSQAGGEVPASAGTTASAPHSAPPLDSSLRWNDGGGAGTTGGGEVPASAGTTASAPHSTPPLDSSLRWNDGGGAGTAAHAGTTGEGPPDVVLVEVGGTVGDIEGQPFLEAIRQMRTAVGRDNTFYVHVTLLPYIGATGELKTKPTQHSVRELRAIGIQPDAIVCRSDHPIPSSIKEKIALFCDVAPDAVIPMQTLSNIYEAPLVLEREGVGDILMRELGLSTPNGPGLSRWQAMTYRMANPHDRLSIAVVGKYADLPDAYLSVREALRHASLHFDRDVSIDWVRSEDIERDGPDAWLGHTLGIVVPGGFGSRGIEGMIQTVRYARERQLPYLGLCLGMQVMVIEHARNVLGLAGANSTEFDPETAHPVIDLMLDQRSVNDMGGTMRLGNYPCVLAHGTRAAKAYGVPEVNERHRHRFEFNNAYREPLYEMGLLASGLSPDGTLVEIVEAERHPFMVGVQFHPEFRSRPEQPHPLFREFAAAATQVLREGAQPELPMSGS